MALKLRDAHLQFEYLMEMIAHLLIEVLIVRLVGLCESHYDLVDELL